MAATSDNSQQEIETEVGWRKKIREFSAIRHESNLLQQPPLPPNSSNKKQKRSTEEELSIKQKEPQPEAIPEDYEVKPPVSFDFPISNGPSRELSLAEAFQMRRGDIVSREKTKRDRSKPEKTK